MAWKKRLKASLSQLHHFSITRRQVFAEIEAKHAAHRLRAKGNTMFFRGCGKTFSKLPGAGGKFFVEVRRLHQLQRGEPAATATGLPESVPA